MTSRSPFTNERSIPKEPTYGLTSQLRGLLILSQRTSLKGLAGN